MIFFILLMFATVHPARNTDMMRLKIQEWVKSEIRRTTI